MDTTNENGPSPQHAIPAATGEESDAARSDPLQVVALGASAGGLEALEKFFDNVPSDSGLTYVVVQHLSPDFKSLMNELLARHTELSIHRVQDGMQLEPDAIYLMPPKKEMIVADDRLLLTDKDPSRALSLPIDTFMRSMAQEYGKQAIGVILSGTGSDGSRGIKAIHEAGGLVLAQDEQSASFDGMPRSAVETGVVDIILAPQQMPNEILHRIYDDTDIEASEDGRLISEVGMTELVGALREAYGIDFSYYKPTTVTRRVERRLQLCGFTKLSDYAQSVLSDKEELNALYRDLLIGVTKFYRDSEAFHLLEVDVIPQLLSRAAPDDELRVWIAGCATGEEAYSVAILLDEAVSKRALPLKVKVFATDVHRASLEFASAGIYSEESLSKVSSQRLQKYFLRQSTGYQVTPDLRKMIVFAPHNVVKDAPFTKLDLICCRNLLIYLQPEAQNKALSLFHFGLRTGGCLFLGPSESTADLCDEFDSVDRHWKIFRKRRDVRLSANMRLPLSAGLESGGKLSPTSQTARRSIPEHQLLKAYDALLEDYVPASLLVDERRKLVHSFTGAGKFLAIPNGRPPEDILEYVDPDLKLALAGALQRAMKEKLPVVYGKVNCRALDANQQLRLSVRPVSIQSTGEDYYLITFESRKKEPPQQTVSNEIDLDGVSLERINELEDELRYAKENLQASVEEMETTNEELQATNEELVASNEELQSTNEELHSVNEELYTVNAEHQRKITELTELTDDMDNLLLSTEIGTIFLDPELRIRKSTPQISRLFQILPQDVGRPLDAFTHNIRRDSLLDDVRGVLTTNEPFEQDVRDRHGKWYLLRILPYRRNTQFDGAVLTLIDIENLKQSEEQLRRMSKVFMDGADPIIIEDLNGKIVELNKEAERAYGWTRDELLGKDVVDSLVPKSLLQESNELRRRCRDEEPVRNVETWRRTKSGETRPILLTLSLLSGESGRPVGIATIAKDIAARKAAEDEAYREVKRRDEFLAMLSHELRNPLGAVTNAVRILDHEQVPSSALKESSNVILRQTKQMARLLDDLLDVSRVTQGKIEIRKEVVDLASLLEDAVQVVSKEMLRRKHSLEVAVSSGPIWVEGDPSRLLQIQENLLMNAAKYTPDGGKISLSVSQQACDAVIKVTDNGTGIPNELLPSIFDLFVQAEKPLDRSDGGMGVGLSLARMLADLHGGSVTARSDGKDQGSEFTVVLPITEEPPTATSEVADILVDKSTRVLVIEDNDDSRRMLEQLLQLEGYQVAVANDGESGYKAIMSDAADVALVDIGLPRMDGYELARKVRTELCEQPIRLVALTGYGQVDDRRKVLEAGFDEHLVKPVAPDELARVLTKPR
ncbi:MAG: chemotaxis protein CheB [Planctomycetota bacterium]